MRPWDQIDIDDSGEPLVPIAVEPFRFEAPHPYARLGAPYGAWSPWFLRREVHARLLDAQRRLSARRPGWRLHLFDAWRPLAVQAFMEAHTERLVLREAPHLDAAQRRERVLTYWAPPSDDPRTPPPHSTGAAIDLTLCDAQGAPVNMGAAFDEPTERSWPEHFAAATDAQGREAHAHRLLLREVMFAAGFVGLPTEWWHFSFGDRAWARETDAPAARYGRTEPR